VQIERSFLSSRVARRVFFLFILCALLPVGALSLVSFSDVTGQLTQQAERRVRQESKVVGMAIYQRLLFLESKLLSLIVQGHPSSSPGPLGSQQEAMPNTPLFLGLAQVIKGGAVQVLFGENHVLPALSPTQWSLLRDNKTHLITANNRAGSRRVFLVRAVSSGMPEEQAVIAEINGEYIWGLVRQVALPTDLAMCVFASATEILFCSESAPAQLPGQWSRHEGNDNPSVYEWSDGQDSYIAGYWAIPLRYQFSTAPWTVLLSESRRSVLAPLASFHYRFSLVVVIALLCVALLSVNQIRKTMVPLEELGEGTRRIAKRNFATPVQVKSGDEFEELAASFNAMACRLNQQFTQLATIHEIDRSVLSVLDPSRIVNTVLARLREVSPCQGLAVLLIDPSERTRGWLYARLGPESQQTTMQGVTVTEAESRMLTAHRDGSTLVQPSGAGAFAALRGRGNESLLVLPLFRSHDLLGGIVLSYRQAPDMHEDHIMQLRQLADQVAVALSNASDLAERKRAESSLRESHTQLEAAMAELKTTQQQMVQQERLRALGQMASGIAHDFNNTLSPIMGFSELLLIAPQMASDPAQLKEYLQTINMAAKDAAKVVSRLRDFYRPRLDADLAGIVDLNSLVQQSVKLSQPKWKDQALANGVAIEIKTELEPVPSVAGHESELREVLTNLVFNAVDAMPKSGSITLRTKVDGDAVRLEVSDTGTGMTEEVRQRCLEPFFSTKGEKGSGLGLAMVYGIIRRLRGTIDITSAVGVGTTFSIRLPIQTEAETGTEHDGHNMDGVRLQVLVVDDDPLVGRVTGEYLRVAGHSVEVVGSAAEAIKRFNPERVHLVVTDHGMPHMTGRQLAGVIKKVSPDTPVLLLTGGDQIEPEDTVSQAVDAELSKPLTMGALRQALSTLRYPKSIPAESQKEIGDAA
jgi:signal transduction histidine kinase/ActR/RegA family two-component response regulator